MAVTTQTTPLFDGSNWDFETMRRTYDAIADIAQNDLGLNIYPNQVEVISSEQMLDAYSSIGMPLMYQHWSFGKQFVQEENLYDKGLRGLAYEIVINSNPCISYNMEENSMAMQTLVMAHAAFGHNHFFKNNYLFRQWTDADAILDYMEFAKNYIAKCEERHGHDAVEEVLDAAHALMSHGVYRYRRPPRLTVREDEERRQERLAYEERAFNDLWRTVPTIRKPEEDNAETEALERKKSLHLPEENLLHFVEKYSPTLKSWQRDILQIVRAIAQYFYPQRQTKVMNEGCACFVHYYIVNKLFDQGLLTEGAFLEILHSHSSVLMQPDFDDPRYAGLSPYALGFAMMQDIRRICEAPTAEDRNWFPEIAGNDDWRGVLRHAWENFRDESFIQQYLSPHLIRRFKLFALKDNAKDPFYEVIDIHNEQGYRNIREKLAKAYDPAALDPDIQITDVDLLGDRRLKLRHTRRNDILLDEAERDMVLAHLETLWGYDVVLETD